MVRHTEQFFFLTALIPSQEIYFEENTPFRPETVFQQTGQGEGEVV